ncbi:DgyrCDS13648 [Dimorphilus gyrociliatus]|nr:DgyrCDS13648 [Dimorphilus gyrociliatus]
MELISVKKVQKSNTKRPFKCESCRARFFDRQNLKKHLVIHLEDNEDNKIILGKVYLTIKKIKNYKIEALSSISKDRSLAIYLGKNRKNEEVQLTHFQVFNKVESDILRLKHENIILLIDSFVFKKKFVFVFERGNTTLRQEIHENAMLTIAMIKQYVYQMKNGLLFLHENGFGHGNLKPDCILIKSGTIKFSGFRHAFRLANPCRLEGVTNFTYHAPEVILNKELSDKADIWALGVMIYELCYKKHPFYGHDQQQLRSNILNYHKQVCDTFIDNDILRFLCEAVKRQKHDRRLYNFQLK